MRKKYLLPVIIIGITASLTMLSCSKDTVENKDVSTTSTVNSSNDDKTNENNSDNSDKTESKSADKDSNVSKSESTKNKSAESNNKKSESNSTTKNSSNKSESTPDKAKDSQNSTLSKNDAVNKILAAELNGQTIPKYCIPVKAAGDNYDTLEKSEGSNAFLCNDDNKLDNGILVELAEFNNNNEVNTFVIRDYNAIKNGGKGTIDRGSITQSGEVNFN